MAKPLTLAEPIAAPQLLHVSLLSGFSVKHTEHVTIVLSNIEGRSVRQTTVGFVGSEHIIFRTIIELRS